MDSEGAAQSFAAALRELYEKAGSPPYKKLVYQGLRQRPQVKLSASSLSDWLHGTSIPSSPNPVRFLVTYLQPEAKQNGYTPRSPDRWEELRAAAWKEKNTNRGGRPSTLWKPPTIQPKPHPQHATSPTPPAEIPTYASPQTSPPILGTPSPSRQALPLDHAADGLAKEVHPQDEQAAGEHELISPAPTDKLPARVASSVHQSLFHTRYVVDFELGFKHTLVYERRDKFVLGVVFVFWLDGVEIFRGGVTSAVGRTVVNFTVEGELARLTITGLLMGVSVSVKVGDLELLKV